MPAARRGRSGRASRGGLGRTRAQVRRRCRSGSAPGCGGGPPAPRGRFRVRRARRRLPRAPRPAGGEAGREEPARGLQSARLPRRHARRRSRPVSAAQSRGPRTRDDRPAGVRSGRPRRRRHGGAGAVLPVTGSEARRDLLRGRRRAAVHAGLGASGRGGVHRPLRRQADPPPRARDDPGSGAARARASLPCRRLGPAPAAARPTGRRTSSTCTGSTTSSCPASCAARPARSASSERRPRQRG